MDDAYGHDDYFPHLDTSAIPPPSILNSQNKSTSETVKYFGYDNGEV
jgi:hypothetical protein